MRIVWIILAMLSLHPTWAAETAAPESGEGRPPRIRREAGLDIPEGISIHQTPRPRPPAPPAPPSWLNRRDIKPHTKAPIWASFYKNFRKCAPDCAPGRIGTHGQRPNPTCHTGGHAIDIHNIICGGKSYSSGSWNSKFGSFVKCMKGSMKTIYMSANHYDHAHFSNGCVRNGRRMW